MEKGTHTLPSTTKDRNENQNKKRPIRPKKTKTKKMKTKSLQKNIIAFVLCWPTASEHRACPQV